MKLQLHFFKHLCLLIPLLVAAFFADAQTTINTTIGSSGYTGNTSTSTNSFVTFVVANNSGAGVLLTDVGTYATTSFNNGTISLWYSSTSLSGNPGTLGAPNWTMAASATVTGITGSGVAPVLTGQSFLIPNGATYRFALRISNTSIRYSSGSPSPNNFTASGVSLYTGNYQISGMNVGYVNTINPRYFTGFITFIPAGPPCPAPTGLSASNILSNSATLSWNAVSGSVGYEYIIDQNATVPNPNTPVTTTNTSVNETGLTPSTQYYLHVRNKCSNINKSPWVDYSFTTLPPCDPPIGFNVTNLLPTSATINWSPLLSALNYDYIVDQTPNTPTSTTGATNTTSTTANLTGLQEYTWYYVHIRSNCAGNQQSGWSLDSFLTPVPCRAPELNIEYINTDQAVTYWAPVPSAYEYEYALTTSITPPDLGTAIDKTSILTSALQDGKEYFIHVRCACNSLGVISKSPWSSESFKTFPTSVNHVAGDVSHIEAYPNPVKNILTVTLHGKRTDDGVITISDLSGRQMKRIEAGPGKIAIDIDELPAGIYLLRYSDEAVTKIIKINKQ